MSGRAIPRAGRIGQGWFDDREDVQRILVEIGSPAHQALEGEYLDGLEGLPSRVVRLALASSLEASPDRVEIQVGLDVVDGKAQRNPGTTRRGGRPQQKDLTMQTYYATPSPLKGSTTPSSQRPPGVDKQDLILRALDALLRERAAALPHDNPHAERMTAIVTEIKGALS